MNDQLLISRKGRAPLVNIIICASCFGIGVLLLLFTFDGSPGSDDFLAILSPILIMAASALVGVTAYRFTNAYINVYSDRIEGYGMLTKGDVRGQQFRLNRSECTVSIEGSNYICIRGNGATYYMYFTPEEVRQIVDSVQNGTRYASATPYQPPMGQANGYQQPNSQPTQQYQQPQQTAPQNGGNASHESVNTNPQTMIFTCAVCNTQCRVPTGHGVVMITCPKCGNQFRAQTGQK